MSLEMAPFDRAHTSSYQRHTITMSLSGADSESEILVENRRF